MPLPRVAEADDRGKAFAVEVRVADREPDREPWMAFCLDIRIAPGPVDAAALAAEQTRRFPRAVQARTEFFLPTTIERVWWVAGRGECEPRLVHDLEQVPRGEPGQPAGPFPRTDRPLWTGPASATRPSAMRWRPCASATA